MPVGKKTWTSGRVADGKGLPCVIHRGYTNGDFSLEWVNIQMCIT